MKTCGKCKIEKNDLDFAPSCLNRKGSWCRECAKNYTKTYGKTYYENNKKIISEKNYIYRANNKEKIKVLGADYRKNNPNHNKEYRKNNKEQVKQLKRKYVNNKYRTDPNFRLRINLSRSINYTLKNNNSSKNKQSIMSFIPYTIQQLKDHLEKQFEPWMSWDNQGKYDLKTWNDTDSTTWTWQIDHSISQSSLPYASMTDNNFQKCWALENLRPLSAKQNVIDGNRRTR